MRQGPFETLPAKLRERVEEGVPLAGLTTLGVGGPARYLLRDLRAGELGELLTTARRSALEVFVLGGGSNLLVADSGFDGLVVQLGEAGMALASEGESARLRAAAGAGWDELVALAVDAGYGGVECLSGIPGRVGAAPMQNIGAYGQEVAETIETVRVLERASGEVLELPAAACGFAYRSSRFKTDWKGRHVVLEVAFRLPRRRQGLLHYPDLQRYFGAREGGASPGLAEVRRAVLEVRGAKSMLLDPEDPNGRSAGSFFVNPVVEPEVAAALAERAAGERPPPAYPAPGGKVKLSAAWLIEHSGFLRGQGEGRVGLSTRHVLALVNRGGATAAELVAFAARVRRRVRERTGVVLVPEPVFLGFEAPPAALLDRAALSSGRPNPCPES